MAPGDNFVFVNKNARSSTLSRSQGQERRQIFSRAQTSSTTCSPKDFVVVTASNYASPGTNHQTRLRGRDAEEKRQPRLRELAPSELDPFQSFSVHLKKDMQCMLTYCMANAVIAARTRDHARTQSVIRCRYQTVLHIRQNLRSGPSIRHSTVYAIALLLRLECGQGDLDAARAHFKGLVTILDLLDSQIQLPPTLLMSMQASMDHCAALFGENPHLIPNRHLQQSQNDGLLVGGIPVSGLQRLALGSGPKSSPLLNSPYNDFVGPVLTDILRKLHTIDMYHNLVLRKEVLVSSEQLQALFIARLAQQRRLQRSLSPQSETDLTTRAQEVVRLCLVLVHGPPVNIALPRTPFHSSLAQQLDSALVESLVPGVWQPCPELLLWALIMAACISHEEEQWRWVLHYTASACKALQIDSLELLRAHLIKFGFVPDYAALLNTIWNEINVIEQEQGVDPLLSIV
ncbi:hypothetical protein M409DRAFT_55305 [Zasmidium cellare ATCC 36951]|uniref:Uncharacterized protein n=1 Tax=Zasmidium cellare ATCC 36951 TaxID=1080233 RepID=A0A6A6CJ16_ZASCE|nr:uncharacterized protein M409DRAFT_55305 [Zasmidium cellare ATCC 36951]KAF2165942.1 hypothetical protein M409DRAFT_55305 [Zasmidium cellare ATCC 36951]